MAKEMEVKVPDIGNYQDVPVIEVFVKTGDRVEKEASLVTLESDKATMDVPAPEAGVVKSIRLKVGDKVSQGDAVLVLELDAGAGSGRAGGAEAPQPKPEPPPPSATKPESQAVPKAEAPPASSVPAHLDVAIPDIGNYDHVPVIEVFVKDGDTVEKDAPLLTLESDKAAMDVPAPEAGTVRGLKIKAGDKVSKGDPVCTLETVGAAGGSPPPAADRSAATAPAGPGNLVEAPPAPPASALPQPVKDGAEIPYASPAIRKFARELGVNLALVKGSGPRGRITRDDVQSFVKRALQTPAPAAPGTGAGIPAIPAVDFAQFGPVETRPLARIRKLSAAHLHRSWLNIPHVTQTDEADITELEAFRKAQSEEGGVKLTLLPFILKALAKAMLAYPEFNASLAPGGESLIMKKYLHLGFAADTPNGLVVPVVRDVDRKGIVQLAQETAELAKKARDGKLKPDEMKGGCFSVSSLGGIGGSHFTPIVNAPEVGILGVSRSTFKPVWDGQQFQPRLMVPLSLSYDHRVIDGAYAARFIVLLVKLLQDLRRLVL
ncbi:MAG: dihydrolipoyllysine-residue acetyltransferase [Nevskia sp.]|nr:dihydrolipoyllysine-residue acetyltransferase [Nevskia sp.]